VTRRKCLQNTHLIKDLKLKYAKDFYTQHHLLLENFKLKKAVRYHHVPLEWPMSIKQTTPNAGEDVM
jgi:hypothetical protein